jgi:hypothetical protein
MAEASLTVAQLIAGKSACLQQLLRMIQSNNADVAGLTLVLVSILSGHCKRSPEVMASVSGAAVPVVQAAVHMLQPHQPLARQALAIS